MYLKLCVVVALWSSPALVNCRQQPGLQKCLYKCSVQHPMSSSSVTGVPQKTGSSDPGTESNPSGTADSLSSGKKPRNVILRTKCPFKIHTDTNILKTDELLLQETKEQ